MSSGKPDLLELSAPADSTDAAWEETLHNLESGIASAVDMIRMDASNLGPFSPVLLQRLCHMFDRCTDARVTLRLSPVSPEVSQIMDVLFPHVDLSSSGSLGIGLAHMLASDSAIIEPNEAEIEAAVHRLLFLLNDLKLSNRSVFLLRSLFEEVMTNIRLHAGLREGEKVFYQIRIEGRKTVMVFADNGTAFDPTTWSRRTGPVSRAPGDSRLPFGIKLVRRVSSRTEYWRVQDTTNVLLVERVKGRDTWRPQVS